MDTTTQQRPWGSYATLAQEEGRFLFKKIVVHGGKRLSLQSHAHRSEHWIVLSGRGEVTVKGDTLVVGPGSHVFVPRGAKHRMTNADTTTPLEFVEVQTGAVLSEDDIVRYEDDFGRCDPHTL